MSNNNTILEVMSTNWNGMTESGGSTEIAVKPERSEGMRLKCRNAAI